MPRIPEGHTQIGLYLPSELWEELRALAKAEDRTLKKTMERLLREGLERRKHRDLEVA